MSRFFHRPLRDEGASFPYPTRNFAHLVPTFRLGVDYLFILPEGGSEFRQPPFPTESAFERSYASQS